MANHKVSETSELKIKLNFADKDDRTLVQIDPVDNLTKEAIKEFEAVCKSTNVLIGDKAGADFLNITDARTVKQKRVQVDLR